MERLWDVCYLHLTSACRFSGNKESIYSGQVDIFSENFGPLRNNGFGTSAHEFFESLFTILFKFYSNSMPGDPNDFTLYFKVFQTLGERNRYYDFLAGRERLLGFNKYTAHANVLDEILIQAISTTIINKHYVIFPLIRSFLRHLTFPMEFRRAPLFFSERIYNFYKQIVPPEIE